MERRQLLFFLEIAEAGSFTRAASRLTIAQPSLSQAIRALENELGTPLFERLGRGVRLTPAGEALVGPARRTLRSFTLATRAVRSVSEAGYGRLTIVANTLWTLGPLAELIGEMRRLHPACSFVVNDPQQRNDVLDQVRAGDADFGLLDGAPPERPLTSRVLLEEELVAVLPPGRQQRSSPMTVAELVPMGLICTPRGTALRSLLDEQLEAAAIEAEPAVETAHLASVVPLVLAHAGVALLPQGLAADATVKGAHVVQLDPPSRARVSLVWRDGRLGDLASQLTLIAAELYGDGGRLLEP